MTMVHHSKRKCDFKPVPADELPNLVGRHVHLSWAYAGATWILRAINPDGTVSLETPKTGKRLTAKAAEVCFTRAAWEFYSQRRR